MAVTQYAEVFAKPVLHLVIAEDEAIWSERLRALEASLRQWSLCRTGQFELKVHTCRSVESFKDLVGSRLAAKEFVYATLDLGMLLKESDDRFSEQAGKEMVLWCLEQRRKGQRLEFCLVSARDAFVDTLYRQSSELESQKIKKIFKSELENWPAAEARLLQMVEDIQDFMRRSLSFCTFKLSGIGETIIWFGTDEVLGNLLGRADRIGNAKEAGVYIILSDAGGYEIDWVRLCCELRGLHLKDLDIRTAGPELQPDWQVPFADPPEALLVRNVDLARNRGCDIAPLLDSGFFDRVGRRNSLVFFQFPRFQTPMEAQNWLDEDVELPILNACLGHIGFEQGEGFESHRRIIIFPSYDTLHRAGVVRRSIEFQVIESSRHLDCRDTVIDSELLDVVEEIPWEKHGGLQQLRLSVRAACKKHSGQVIAADAFKGDRTILPEFHGELGLVVRGRRLYNLLRNHANLSGAKPWAIITDPEQALENLEVIWQLYDGLDRLQQLGAKLEEKLGQVPTRSDFTSRDYESLHDAWSFLQELFESPATLRERINRFRIYMADRAWSSYYPILETKRSKAAVENIRFTWPFTSLPLHPAVAAYLRMNRVRALIHRDIDDYLDRYSDLASNWVDAERAKEQLFGVIMQREAEREAAEFYVRENHSQAVLVHLVPHVTQEERRSPFDKILESFFIFNAFLALAENHYVLGVLRHKPALQKVLNIIVNQGPMLNLLCEYKNQLPTRGAEHSVFWKWRRGWALAGQQTDAIRLSKLIADVLLAKYRRSLSKKEFSTVLKVAQEGSKAPQELGIGSILEMSLIIRNKFYKSAGGDFELAYGKHLRDLFRRLVAATTADYRIGRIDDAGATISLWRKQPYVKAEAAKLTANGSRWPGRLVLARKTGGTGGVADGYEELFPIDDLIRIDPDRGSIWGYYNGKSGWKNLTHVEGSGEELQLSAEEGGDWLPTEKELEDSELWRSIHDG